MMTASLPSKRRAKPVFRQIVTALLAVQCIALPIRAGAEGLPDLGDSSAAAISPQAERKVGEQIFNEVRTRESSYLRDPEVADYLNNLAARLAAQFPGGISDYAGPHGFVLFPLRDSTLNAFAMPGGYIGVHTGLLLAAQSESELASVLAHEISHVTQRHIARSFSSGGMSQMAMLLSLAVAILAARSNPDVAMGAAIAGQAASIQSKLNYSRDFEREADRLGLQLLERSGFDTRAMPAFFHRMLKFGNLYDNSAPAYLRTHPLTTERIAAIEDRIHDLPARFVPDSIEFLLARAKVRALTQPTADAATEFESRLKGAVPREALTARYGLARTWLLAGDLDKAASNVEAMSGLARGQKIVSPMLDTLRAELHLARRDTGRAVSVLQEAQAHYPREHAVNYLLVDALLADGRPSDALALTRDYLHDDADDPTMHAAQARAYAQLGRIAEQHRAQAESYLLLGQLRRAIEQLELAQRADTGNFYASSEVDARLRELKKRRRDEMEERRRNGGGVMGGDEDE